MAAIGSLLDLKSITSQKFELLFHLSEKLRQQKMAPLAAGDRLALLFFEPSTRTRMSFESAAYRCGLGPLVFDGGPNTSLEKGETVEDSILNVAAMKPKAIVVRCGDSVPLNQIFAGSQIPMINAGWGVKGHPTQALLDAATIQKEFGTCQGKKLLILGDVKHSRVAASHFELLPKLGAQIAICGPDEFLIPIPGVETFRSLPEALKWADVVMALRVQFERHVDAGRLSSQEYHQHFGITDTALKHLSQRGIIMHPGPINHGIEMSTAALKDPRCRIMEQVTMGVYIREAILRDLLGEDIK